MRSTVPPLTDRYRRAIFFTMAQQVPSALLCLLVLDGGRMARVCGVALLGFWAAAGLMMARRPTSPGPGDLAFLRWGFFPLFASAALLVTCPRILVQLL